MQSLMNIYLLSLKLPVMKNYPSATAVTEFLYLKTPNDFVDALVFGGQNHVDYLIEEGPPN